MRTNIFNKLLYGLAISATLFSCDKEIPNNGNQTNEGSFIFNVVASIDQQGSSSPTYSQAHTDLSTGEISFKGAGFEVPAVRTARVYASENGRVLYNLSYGGGTLHRYELGKGAHNYLQTHEINVAPSLGTAYPRWTKVSEENALVHNVNAKENIYDEATGLEYQYTKAIASFVNIDLSDMGIISQNAVEIPRNIPVLQKDKYLYVFRIDAPAILDGKAYYGLAMSRKNPENTAESDPNWNRIYPATTLVVDYPSMKNPSLTTHNTSKGSTYGYRCPVAHVYNNAIYQIGDDGRMLKLKDGVYDNSYDFNISTALGFEVGTQGWYNMGDGIGYCFFEKLDTEEWGIARIDLNSKTAIKMNVPAGLDLFSYQMAKEKDGKLYMSLNPVGKDGNIYIFDKSKADADGFTKGATLKHFGGESMYLGVF